MHPANDHNAGQTHTDDLGRHLSEEQIIELVLVIAPANWTNRVNVGLRGLTVTDDPVTSGVRVLTYPSSGGGIDALALGTLGVRNGCHALETGGGEPYLLLPDGYEVVERSGGSTLISPTGERVGALGDVVSFGGGYSGMSATLRDSITGGVPEACRDGAAFIASGPAD